MAIDTLAAIRVNRPCAEVAAYLQEPTNDVRWIGGLRAARLVSPPPVGVGSQVARVAAFLGRRIEYVNEITELSSNRLAMRSIRAPFPMRVTYEFRETGNGATETSVRVQGNASGFYQLASPLLGKAVQRSISRDLRTLKRVLEHQAGEVQR